MASPVLRHLFVPRAALSPDGPAAGGSERTRRERERRLDEELAQSFPASDPPSWTMGVATVEPSPAGTEAAAREQRIDEELAQSFPASDPPGWTLG